MQPEDLTGFWQLTIKELARTGLNSALEEAPDQSGREYVTYRVALDSFGGRRLRAWYSVPKDPPPGGKFPAVPGYEFVNKYPI